MPPRRARSASVASNGAPTSRRSSRVPVKVALPAPTSTKAASAKRARSPSVAAVDEDDEELSDAESVATVTGGSKRRAKSPKLAPAKKQKKVIAGINPVSQLFNDPTALLIKPPLLESTLPRHLFSFGNGDFGQHGMGIYDSVLCEIKRPRPHSFFDYEIEHHGTTTTRKRLDAEEKPIVDKETGKEIEYTTVHGEEWKNGVASVVCGGMHTLALDNRGKVYSWGINDNAALGRVTADAGDLTELLETTPMQVEGLEDDFKAVQIAAGDSVSIAVSDKGELRAWGSFRASEGLLGFGPNASQLKQFTPVCLPNLGKHTITQVATGDDHFVALTSKGEIFACGNGEQNQLGRRIIQRHRAHGLTPERLALRNIVLVGSGSFHSFAVDKDGKVYAWGLNSYRQTGVADDDGGWSPVITSPTIVAALDPSLHDGAHVVQIAGASYHTLFLFSNGLVYTVGRFDGNEVGLDHSHPDIKDARRVEAEQMEVRAKRKAVEVAKLVALGMPAAEADTPAGEWAADAVPLPNLCVPEPRRLHFPVDANGDEPLISNIAANSRHSFAVATDGRVFSWGIGNTSQLGLGNEEEAETPTEVKSVKMSGAGYKVIAASTGGQHSVVVAIPPTPAEKPTPMET